MERLKAQEEKESTQKIKLIHFADAKNYKNAFLSFLMLKSWPQSCFFPLSFGQYFQTRYVLFWGSSFQWSWWRPKSCCMKSRLKWNARWSWEKSQVLLDLQRNSIEVGGPGVGQGQLGEQGSEPGSAGQPAHRQGNQSGTNRKWSQYIFSQFYETYKCKQENSLIEVA